MKIKAANENDIRNLFLLVSIRGKGLLSHKISLFFTLGLLMLEKSVFQI